MNISTITKSGRLTHGGVKLAAYVISYPSFGEEAIDGFCRRYAEAFEGAILGRIREELIAEYEASDDPKKRFRTPSCEITLSYRITREEAGILSMVWCAQISRRGEILSCSRAAQTWNSRVRHLLTARDFGIGRRRGSTCNFFLEGEEAVILDGGNELRVPLKHRSRKASQQMPQADSRASP